MSITYECIPIVVLVSVIEFNIVLQWHLDVNKLDEQRKLALANVLSRINKRFKKKK